MIGFTLSCVSQIEDQRVDQLRRHWNAIQSADDEERRFREVAGTMGLDLYDSSEMTADLAKFPEESANPFDDSLIRNLTEGATP